jgi:hypothetical protein
MSAVVLLLLYTLQCSVAALMDAFCSTDSFVTTAVFTLAALLGIGKVEQGRRGVRTG